MKKLVTLAALCCLPIAFAHADEADMKARAEKSKAAIGEFFGKLKGQLEAGMKEGGPVNAIQVCNTVAPALAKEASEKHKMSIGRTSLKTRNPNNVPDEWETMVLNKFAERKAKGEPLDTMSFAEVVESDGKKEYRFMKAIPTGEVCLKCHGENIDPAVKAKLDALYPDDQARGYKLGDLRGAFTIRQAM
ncbi:MAG TPA: DUF3365 domain-containing protein [Gammaproteobacteria bacterium]